MRESEPSNISKVKKLSFQIRRNWLLLTEATMKLIHLHLSILQLKAMDGKKAITVRWSIILESLRIKFYSKQLTQKTYN